MSCISTHGILHNSELIYESNEFRGVLKAAERMASCDRPVIIEGESGTGKARVARIIHELSGRRTGPFQTWSAAEASGTLASSDLFGVVKGAFTGAVRDATGIIEASSGGTLVIDDIDKLQPTLQPQFLRFLDEWSVRRIGSSNSKVVDVRLICTTNRNLRLIVQSGEFLADLAYRLMGLRIFIPALRNRKEDIMPLVRKLAARAAADEGKDPPVFSPEAVNLLQAESWPGNVREVAEVIQNLVNQSDSGGIIDGEAVRAQLRVREGIQSGIEEELAKLAALPERERRAPSVVARALQLADGNGARASRALGIPLRSFRRYLRDLGLARRGSRPALFPNQDSGVA